MVSIAFGLDLDIDRPNYSQGMELRKIVDMVHVKRMDECDKTMFVDCYDVAQ